MRREDKIIRMSMDTWKRLKRAMPPFVDESMVEYFERVEKEVENEINN